MAAVKETCEEIATAPYTARGTHTLSHEWAGFRAADFVRGKRILYRVCEECVQKHQESKLFSLENILKKPPQKGGFLMGIGCGLTPCF